MYTCVPEGTEREPELELELQMIVGAGKQNWVSPRAEPCLQALIMRSIICIFIYVHTYIHVYFAVPLTRK